MRALLFLSLIGPCWVAAQSYTSYFTGNPQDTLLTAHGGVCLMGGASENDEAMKWFLRRANGGDVLVLRTSGSDGYNTYLYSSLGIAVNSVETLVCNSATSAADSYVLQKVAQAEAIWFAGGDQSEYVAFWRGTALDSLIRAGMANRGVVVGGTSAGMAIQGGLYYAATSGSATSSVALANPYASSVAVDSARFIGGGWLNHVITDTHYDNPDRRGRHVTFLARTFTDWGLPARGIACDEYTAVCVDTSGIASVFGEYPQYEDNAYFIQPNCELADRSPETCTPGTPLTWNRGGAALKVYAVKGTLSGSATFDLRDWKTAAGGSWEHWSVSNGVLTTAPGTAPDCVTALAPAASTCLHVSPNPAREEIHLSADAPILSVTIRDLTGKIVLSQEDAGNIQVIHLGNIPSGWYTVQIRTHRGVVSRSFVRE